VYILLINLEHVTVSANTAYNKTFLECGSFGAHVTDILRIELSLN